MSVRYFPAVDRTRFPTHWLAVFGWRQIVAFTPKVGRWALMTTVRVWPRHGGLFVGMWAGRGEEQDNFGVRLGLGVTEIEFDLIEFWPAGRDS